MSDRFPAAENVTERASRLRQELDRANRAHVDCQTRCARLEQERDDNLDALRLTAAVQDDTRRALADLQQQIRSVVQEMRQSINDNADDPDFHYFLSGWTERLARLLPPEAP